MVDETGHIFGAELALSVFLGFQTKVVDAAEDVTEVLVEESARAM